MDDFDPAWGDATRGVRAFEPRRAEREHSAAAQLTSSFVFDSAAQAAAVFSGAEGGMIYSRFTNPTVQAFERRLAALERGDACVATASGMAAILSLCMATLKAGEHIVASRALFGSTINLFNNVLSRFGIATTYVDATSLDAWRAATTGQTRLYFCESPSNPLMEVVDLAGLAQLAREKSVLLAVDNCFLTPVFQRPIEQGAHVVIHSATKFLDGQGRAVGGAVVGGADVVGKDIFGFMRTAGPCMAAFNAWVFLKGLETLEVRVKAHAERAGRVAEWLTRQPNVERVYYTGLDTHPGHALASRQQSGHGGLVSFDLKGGRTAAWGLIDATRTISITANLGDTRTTVTHPASTTHARITPEARASAGIGEGLVRVAVGLEDADDVIADLARGM